MTYRYGGINGFSFGFASSQNGAASLYPLGYYEFESTPDDFSAGATFGTANSPHGAKVLFVLGADAVDDITIRISGTSWNPSTGTRTATDTEDVVIPSGSVTDDYFQSSKKWIGQVTLQQTGGTAKSCNYGFCDFWTKNNHKFWLNKVKFTGNGDANDASADFVVRHHKATGWSYNAAAPPTPPTELARMSTDYSTESDVKTGEQFSYAKAFDVEIAGNDGEGLILEVVQGTASPFVDGNAIVCVSDIKLP